MCALIAAALGAAGCLGGGGTFASDAFVHATYTYSVVKDSEDAFLDEHWRLDNYRTSRGKPLLKATDAFVTTYHLDTDGDGCPTAGAHS